MDSQEITITRNIITAMSKSNVAYLSSLRTDDHTFADSNNEV